jgi:hypothetical protein
MVKWRSAIRRRVSPLPPSSINFTGSSGKFSALRSVLLAKFNNGAMIQRYVLLVPWRLTQRQFYSIGLLIIIHY